MLTLNNPFWSKDQNDLIKVEHMERFFSKNGNVLETVDEIC